ncbi:MAG: divergent polysaccharide deacetylase family protein [Treponema sp.]|nr:divergent polysaccharide deacetylase family protein [Candidatus Treponema equi]
MATRKTAPKKKRSPKKRKPKVKLDNKKVMALAAVIIFFCSIFLVVSFLFSGPNPKNGAGEKQKVAVEKPKTVEPVKKPEPKKPAEKVPSEKNKKTETKKSSTKSKTEQKKAAPAEPKAEVKTEKKPEPKVEQKQEPKVVEKPKSEPKVEKKPAVVEQKKEEPKASNKFNIPQSRNGNTKLCFIIDDGGQSTNFIRKYTTLPFPVTIAVLPRLPATKECARIVVADKKELMLHQPMQAQNLKMNPGPGAILPDMGLSQVYATVSQNLAELGPGVRGFNNHEGSLITCDLNMMGAVLDAAQDNKVYFVDSRTSKDTMAPFAALERDMKILEREVFIDDIIDRGEMLKQIMRGIDIANKKGQVIMIGHVDKSAKILPQLLSEMYPELKAKGYRLVFPSQLL